MQDFEIHTVAVIISEVLWHATLCPLMNGSWENMRERDHWGDPGVDGRIILRWIFRKWNVGIWTGSGLLRIGTDGGHL